jgi:molybdopterin molybdotransferase
MESVPLEEAWGRISADNIVADRDYPALRRSLRDGFAVKAASVPGTLRIRGEVRAGESEKAPLADDEALEIMTGAPVPSGSDAVVMVEHTTREWNGDGSARVRIEQAAQTGQFINEQGAEAEKDAVLVPKYTRLDASHVATAAMVGRKDMRVALKPRVAILATGDEIVEVTDTPGPHQVRNSNSYMLAAMVRSCGGIPSVLPVARDTNDALRPLLEKGLQHDMLLISGGVSAGKYDLVKPNLRDFGTEFRFERVRIQPGQPTAFGIANKTPVFGLPGNPGSTLVTFILFAKAALELLAGQSDPILPLLSAKFEAPFRHKLGLTRFLPARLNTDGQSLRHIPWQGSSDVPALAKANCFLVADGERETWEIGDSIPVMAKL